MSAPRIKPSTRGELERTGWEYDELANTDDGPICGWVPDSDAGVCERVARWRHGPSQLCANARTVRERVASRPSEWTMSDALFLGRDADGQPTARRPPVAGDMLLELGEHARRMHVDYVNDSRRVGDVVHTCCGVSWSVEPSELKPDGRAATTITVRSRVSTCEIIELGNGSGRCFARCSSCSGRSGYGSRSEVEGWVAHHERPGARFCSAHS